MFQTTRSRVAMAVTVTGPAVALRVIGPVVASPGFFAHIHVGIPTIPILPGVFSGTMPIPTGWSFICEMAICATCAGLGGGGGGGAAGAAGAPGAAGAAGAAGVGHIAVLPRLHSSCPEAFRVLNCWAAGPEAK